MPLHEYTFCDEELRTVVEALDLATAEYNRLADTDVPDAQLRNALRLKARDALMLAARFGERPYPDVTTEPSFKPLTSENPCVTYGKRVRTCYRCATEFVGTLSQTFCTQCREKNLSGEF